MASAETVFLHRGLSDIEHAGTALLAIDSEGALLRSTDEGATFTERYVPDAFEIPQGLKAEGTVAIAVCEGGIVLRSSDEGQNWSEADFPDGFATLTSVATDGDGNWVAVGQSTGECYVIRSTDNGSSWSSVDFSHSGSLDTIAYDASEDVWMMGGWELSSGRSGIAFRSTNGTTWSAVDLPTSTGSVSAIAANGAGQFGLVGADGFYAIVNSSGSVLYSAFDTVSESLLAVESTNEGDWIAGGMENVMIRFSIADGGLSSSIVKEASPGAAAVSSLAETASGTIMVASGVGFEAEPDPRLKLLTLDEKIMIEALGLEIDQAYYLLISRDLVNWDEWPSSDFIGTNGTIRWDVSEEIEESTPVFWKLSER